MTQIKMETSHRRREKECYKIFYNTFSTAHRLVMIVFMPTPPYSLTNRPM